jgi:hypothetical protein
MRSRSSDDVVLLGVATSSHASRGNGLHIEVIDTLEMSSVPERVGNEDEDQEDSDFDPKEIVDSDLDVSDGDDDLFEDNVDNSEDEEVKIPKGQGNEKAKAKMLKEAERTCKEEDVEQDSFWGPVTDLEGMPPRFKTFRPEDMLDPKFHVGLCFQSVEQLRKAIQAYSCDNRQDIKMPVNDKKRGAKNVANRARLQ